MMIYFKTLVLSRVEHYCTITAPFKGEKCTNNFNYQIKTKTSKLLGLLKFVKSAFSSGQVGERGNKIMYT